MKKCYKWIAYSKDGSWKDESTESFASQEECYNDMRNHALNKMKWNTDWYDFTDLPTYENNGVVKSQCDGGIGVNVRFAPDMIWQSSYSGVYIWKIVRTDKKEIEDMKMLLDELSDVKNRLNCILDKISAVDGLSEYDYYDGAYVKTYDAMTKIDIAIAEVNCVFDNPN